MNDRIRTLLVLSSIIISLFGIWAALTRDMLLLFDSLFSVSLLLLLLRYRKRVHLSLTVAVVVVITLFMHNINFYDAVVLGIPFDRPMHFFATFAIALLVHNYFHQNKFKLRSPDVLLISVFLSFGIASSIEILEFIGYSFIDGDVGILGYGVGDIGEWNNVSWDLMMNLAGAVAGTFTDIIFKRKSTRKRT